MRGPAAKAVADGSPAARTLILFVMGGIFPFTEPYGVSFPLAGLAARSSIYRIGIRTVWPAHRTPLLGRKGTIDRAPTRGV